MKCPYTIKRTEVQNFMQNFNENGECVSGTTTIFANDNMMDCIKDKCMVYKKGECHYNKTI